MNEKIKELVEQLRQYSTSELCDGMVEYQTMDSEIKCRASYRKIVGPAYPVRCPKGISGIVPDAILDIPAGYIMVIDGAGEKNKSYWGDHRSVCAKYAVVEGVIIDGAMRDVDGCEEAGIPIFARSVTPGSATKAIEGELNVPIRCGGIEVHPGDLVVADHNGVIVFAPERAEEIMRKAQAKVDAEQYTEEEMRRTGNIYPRVIVKKQ